MRKKSHVSLAKYIVHVSNSPNFYKHKKAFYVGSILPDCKPSFLTKRHEINQTFGLVEKRIRKLTRGYDSMDKLSTVYFTRLGEVVHYIADYFTFPHNKEYRGSMKQHCIYEGELKHKLRAYIESMDEKNLQEWKQNTKMEEVKQFQTVADICEFLKEEHRKYICRSTHSVEEDCKYIVRVCAKVVMAILHVCMLTMERKRVYAIVHQ